jgi:hypothetical protein
MTWRDDHGSKLSETNGHVSSPPLALEIATLTEPVKTSADLGGKPRLLIGACHSGGDSVVVAESIAHDLATRLEVSTMLLYADSESAPSYSRKDAKFLANGHYLRSGSTRLPLLRVARALYPGETQNGIRLANGNTRPLDPRTQEFFDELAHLSDGCEATVVDLGPLRINTHWLGLAREDDPVLIVVRYGRTRRDELVSATDLIRLSGKRSGGIIMTHYQSTALDYINRLFTSLIGK